MDDPPPCNQENNQLLLNAIRNKFAAQNASEAAAFSPPKFNIPLLRPAAVVTEPTSLPLKSTATSTQKMSNLNEFILGQLQEKSTLPRTGKGFILPTLNIGNKMSASPMAAESRFQLPTLKTGENKKATENQQSNISLLTSGVHHMSVEETNLGASSAIDLTTALSNNSNSSNSSSASSKTKIVHQDFDIPFIACDIKEQFKVEQYCQPDISHLKLQHCLTAPSCFARITCLKFKRTRDLPRIDHSFKAKHKIQRFRFDTKSPDDIITAKFERYQR